MYMYILMYIVHLLINMAEQDPLHLACKIGHYQTVEALLNHGYNVNGTDDKGITPLVYACGYRHTDIAILLLSRGSRAQVNMQDNDGWSALNVASQNRHSDVVKVLIEKGAQVNIQLNDGRSALMIASQYGHSDVVKILIEKGAQVNIQLNDGRSALMIASQNGHSDVVKILIEKGAQVNMQKNDGWSALMIASENGHSDVIKILIEKGAQVNMQNNDGWSALMIASQNGHSDVVKILIEKRAQVNMQNNDGFSALMIAASQNGHSDVVKVLIEKGAQVNMQDNNGRSALMIASHNGHSDVVKLLIEKGAQVNMQTNNGWSALMIASQNGHSDVVKVFIEKGAQVNMQNNNGWSALMTASRNGHSDVVKVFIEKGAQVNMQNNDGWSALMIASRNGHSDVVKLLIEKGAEVNMQDNDGWPALMIACYNGRKEVARILLDHHADTNIRDRNGKTALSMAIEAKHAEIVELLLPYEHRDTTSSSSTSTDEPPVKRMKIEKESPELSLKVLSMELKTVTDPIQLGVGLGVAQHHLEIIRKNNPQDIGQQQFDLFSFIAKNNIVLGITWERIADTLEELVGMGDLAQEIRKKFINFTQPGLSVVEAELVEVDFFKERISEGLFIFKDKPIGSGAFGTVFRGELNGGCCAVKVLRSVADEIQTQLPTASLASTDSVERFRKECEFFESFRHPNIVRHLATKKYPKTNHLVLALELMDCNLRQYFTPQADKEPIKLSLAIQTSLCHDIASALEYIHSRGVVHRDLCGENILLSCGGETPVAKVCDFGMSKITKNDTRSVSLQAFAHKGFMPPEATDMESSSYNSKFDIFSFGALMVQIVRHLPTIKDGKYRKYELKLINETHPIKELIIDCLNENRDDRPLAAQLKRRLEIRSKYSSINQTVSEGNAVTPLATPHTTTQSEHIGESVVEITNKSKKFSNFGIKISVPENSLPEGIGTCVLHISFELSTDLETPANFELLSSIYRVKCEPKVQFKKPLTLEIQHCASLSSDHQQKLVFARATDQSKKFEILEGGHFPIGERYGSIQLTRFSRLGVFIRKLLGFPTEKMYSALLFRKNLPCHTIDVKCVICRDLATHVQVIREELEEKDRFTKEMDLGQIRFENAVEMELHSENPELWTVDRVLSTLSRDQIEGYSRVLNSNRRLGVVPAIHYRFNLKEMFFSESVNFLLTKTDLDEENHHLTLHICLPRILGRSDSTTQRVTPLATPHTTTQSGGLSAEEHPSKTDQTVEISKLFLTGADIQTIRDSLKNASKDWFDLGLALGMNITDLKDIEDQHANNKRRLTEMVGKRLEVTDPEHPMTWPYICDCLRRPTVARNDVAKEIEDKYVRTATAVAHSATN
ncbi:uncharacterized protein LOC135348400 isoform X9 [Halichondria panicea]|uniref:uncharacterized protein LOC135348400 isoform X9 n=1 Tax=Halichondria panicea TaxID=6063 RepID=UPI00312BA772